MGWLKKILLALVVIVILILGIGFLLPRQVHVERSITIDAPRATVFALVDGFRTFNKWSPWFDADPEATYTYDGPDFGVGAKMSWQGDPKKVGAGSQEIVETRAPELVKARLDFGEQGAATATYVLSREGPGTKVTWGFDTDLGGNPLARYTGLFFDRMIGADYEKGLGALKSLAESLPKTDFEGLQIEVVEVEPTTLAYVETSSSKDEPAIAAAIGVAYGQIQRFMKANGLNEVGPPLTINIEWGDSGTVFEPAIVVDRAPEKEVPADSPVKVKTGYAGKALKVVHVGPYREMAATYDKLDAFVAAHGYERAGPPWDAYVSDPGETPEDALVTHVYVPVR